MKLTAEQSRVVLAQFGCFVKEICDKCGAALGAVRFTRKDDHRAWCSQVCRGDGERPAIRRGGRPRKHKTDADKQRVYRASLGVTKPPRSLAETKDLQEQKLPLSTIPLTPLLPALETAPNERQAGQ
jgi:hypothetical protein